MDDPSLRRARFEQGLCALLQRFGAPGGEQLAQAVSYAVEQMLEALRESSQDGQSLTPLEVVRIRANKFAAAHVPAAVFRDAQQLTSLRSELRALARALLAEDN